MCDIDRAHYSKLTCRICNSNHIKTLPVCEYAPFFQLRVDVSKDPFLLKSKNKCIFSSDLPFYLRVARKISKNTDQSNPKPFRTYGTFCFNCNSLTPTYEYSYEELQGLYRDYRSKQYNLDRISVEPDYAKIAKLVGNNQVEVTNRNNALDLFMKKNAGHFEHGSALDYGGSDGQFISKLIQDVFTEIDIFDVSDSLLHPTVRNSKIKKISSLAKFDYDLLLCMHVLEHVGSPRDFLIQALKYVSKNGCIYLEIPLELNTVVENQFSQNVVDMPFIIHEHINAFDFTSIQKLADSIQGLILIDSDESIVDLGWIQNKIGRYLLKKSN